MFCENVPSFAICIGPICFIILPFESTSVKTRLSPALKLLPQIRKCCFTSSKLIVHSVNANVCCTGVVAIGPGVVVDITVGVGVCCCCGIPPIVGIGVDTGLNPVNVDVRLNHMLLTVRANNTTATTATSVTDRRTEPFALNRKGAPVCCCS